MEFQDGVDDVRFPEVGFPDVRIPAVTIPGRGFAIRVGVGLMDGHCLIVQLLQAAAGAAHAGQFQQKAGVASEHPHAEQKVHIDGQVVLVFQGRGVGGDDGHLLGGDAFQRGDSAHGRAGRPAGDFPAGDGGGGINAPFQPLAGVGGAQGAAVAGMLGAVHADDAVRHIQVGMEVAPEFQGTEVYFAVPLHQAVGVSAGQDDDFAVEGAHLKDGAVPPVLAQQEGHCVGHQAAGAADDGQAPGPGYGGTGAGFGRRRRGRFRGAGDGLRHRAGDGEQLPHRADAGQCRRAFIAGEDEFKDAAGVGQSDDGGVLRGGDVAAEQDAHNPQPDFLDGGAVASQGVTAGTGDRAGEGVAAAVVGVQDAAPHQPGQGALADGGGVGGGAGHPVVGGVRPLPGSSIARRCVSGAGDSGDFGQDGVEEVVVHRRRVDEDEARRVGVDAALAFQIHQDGAGQGVVEGAVG